MVVMVMMTMSSRWWWCSCHCWWWSSHSRMLVLSMRGGGGWHIDWMHRWHRWHIIMYCWIGHVHMLCSIWRRICNDRMMLLRQGHFAEIGCWSTTTRDHVLTWWCWMNTWWCKRRRSNRVGIVMLMPEWRIALIHDEKEKWIRALWKFPAATWSQRAKRWISTHI